MRVERVDFVSIPVRDRERARRFYGELLELPVEGRRRTSSRPST